MRDLSKEELDVVSGGFGLVGAGIGAAIGFASSIGAVSADRVFAATLLGAISGAAGNLAGSAAVGGMAVRGAWALRAVGTGVAGSAAGSGDGKEEDS